MLRTSTRRDRSPRFRPLIEGLEGRALLAVGQISMFIPTPAVGTSSPVRGKLPDGSIDILQFNVGYENPTTIGSTTGGVGTGKVKFGPLEIVTQVGSQSGALFAAEALGAHFNTLTLYVRDAGARVMATYEFKLVFVTSIQDSGDNSGDPPTEDVQLTYGAIRISTFNPVTLAMIAQTSFSLVTNQPVFDVPGVTAARVVQSSISPAAALQTQVPAAQATPSAVTTLAATTIRLTTVTKPHGATTTLKAKVTSAQGVPTGNVTFYAGKTLLGSSPVTSNGTATVVIPAGSAGHAHIFAIYSGGPGSSFKPATTIGGEAVIQKSFQKWLGRPMTQDEWVLTSMWLQEGFTPAKMGLIYRSLAGKTN
jgi:type VI protein secretion system component Hcp